ncbi:hypothetical protein L6654_29175 [Bradyrhizobium sp. WYCCWR 13023]|uniref:Capsular biosynthesis protein n=1 Tax=Bradyrhizobium zhengyangense TaxID=2911009 RepID=A0A9X1RDW3_9BRAD|nr:hypothetical protein [Bradyrhizobium zhengyangense]MCG2630711.1 hypothetical protein [Bradyrhizobium zhengyangense]
MNAFVRYLRRSPFAGGLADLRERMGNAADYQRLRDEVARTFANMAFARELPAPTPGAPTVLILSMTNDTYTAKLECMQALALRRRGWRVKVLTSGIYTHAKRLYKAFGVIDFLAFEKLVDIKDARAAAIAEVQRRSDMPMDFQSVMEWRYRDAWIGPQLLSSVSRRGFDGAPDPRKPEVREAIIQRLRESVGFVHAAEKSLAVLQPSLILVNEPNYHTLGPFVDVAIKKGIPTIHFTQPSREDALVHKKLTRDTRRIHPNSVTRDTLERLLKEPWGAQQESELDNEFGKRYGGVWKVQARNQPGTIDVADAEIRRELGLDQKPVAVLFSHVLWDANLFYGKDIFENYGDWFAQTVKAAVANPRINWLIKLHPANIWKRKLSGASGEYGELRIIRESVGELPPHVKLLPADTRFSTLSLFRMADVGITVRGSIGYELPCFGVPVITAGTGRYSGFGFTEDHSTRESYLDALASLERVSRLDPEKVHLARVHAHALFVRRPWVYKSFKTEIGPDFRDPLFQNLVPVVTDDADIRRNHDLDEFARWAELSEEIDYLAPRNNAG